MFVWELSLCLVRDLISIHQWRSSSHIQIWKINIENMLKRMKQKNLLFCFYCILCVFRLNNVLGWWCKDNWCWCWITRGLCLLSGAMSRELLWQWDPMYGLYAFTSNVWIHLIHWIVGAGHCWIQTDRTTTIPSLHDMTKIFSITSRKIFHTSTITVFKCMNNTRHISQYLILIYLL